MNIAKNTAPKHPASTKGFFRGVAVILAACLFVMTAVKIALLDPKKARDDANATVVANAKASVTTAMSHWSTTQPALQSMQPDVHWSGKDAKIIAIYEDDGRAPYLNLGTVKSTEKAWRVIAKTRNGNYFTVRFQLCTDCSTDADNIGWKRLFSLNFHPLEASDVKQILYEMDMRQEFKDEFGSEAPPRRIEG
ncbi:hypothetical protein F3J14_04280 [Burkholderia sp. Tr-862]|uniref:hypothetical protein n=1 Tax=Burkholderia sp. Tr-862 TaxID=2608331 RepID=UPI0014195AB6|nr:hypothetical protein [Burkholderia sp. Tr-862]NIF40130.1 hypothetical protein [Burkholderia sp. Tr-862]